MTDISDPIQSISTNDTQKAEVEDIELINYVLGTKTSKSIFTVKILNFIILGIILFIFLSLPQIVNLLKQLSTNTGVLLAIRSLIFAIIYFAISYKYFI
jgi:hypothetical protein